MRLFRIGDKVISREKLFDALEEILEDREAGATQEEVARAKGVQRSFVSFLESIGEVRRGARIALVGFPIENAEEVKELAERLAIDFVLVVSQAERESIEAGSATEVFNRLLETLATLRDYDVIVLMASDWRIELIERILGREIIGIPLGHSPIREDKRVDIAELERLLAGILAARGARPRSGRVSSALREAAERAGRWNSSKRS
ncbi:MAG: transcriptional regulator [Actinomycetota bacterium]|nr:transcriptional regulator [Actinomycetota bacterium]